MHVNSHPKSYDGWSVSMDSVCMLTVIPSHMIDEVSAWTVCVCVNRECVCVCSSSNAKSCDG